MYVNVYKHMYIYISRQREREREGERERERKREIPINFGPRQNSTRAGQTFIDAQSLGMASEFWIPR